MESEVGLAKLRRTSVQKKEQSRDDIFPLFFLTLFFFLFFLLLFLGLFVWFPTFFLWILSCEELKTKYTYSRAVLRIS